MLKLRKTEPGEPLIVSMASLRLGHAVLFLGCDDPKSIATLSIKPGLTGRACAVDPDPAKVAAAVAAAQAEGALLEGETASFTELPFGAETFDVVVCIRLFARLDETTSRPTFSQALRVLRPGGRCVVIEGGASKGFAGFFASSPAASADTVERALQDAGFRGARTLAERDRTLFVEGARSK